MLTDREVRSKNIPETEWDYDAMDIIWGIPSATGDIPTYDCELIYHKDSETYSFDIDCTYAFGEPRESVRYLRRMLKAFTKWMNENNYDVNYTFPYYDVFADKMHADTCFKTIEGCYANFKMQVSGYAALVAGMEGK